MIMKDNTIDGIYYPGLGSATDKERKEAELTDEDFYHVRLAQSQVNQSLLNKGAQPKEAYSQLDIKQLSETSQLKVECLKLKAALWHHEQTIASLNSRLGSAQLQAEKDYLEKELGIKL